MANMLSLDLSLDPGRCDEGLAGAAGGGCGAADGALRPRNGLPIL
ncbi:MAG TPA: hypothetical protein PK694_10175 [Rhodospirillales bacterium]|nr:hypothetical protein [Rhodospirillales bacterium]